MKMPYIYGLYSVVIAISSNTLSMHIESYESNATTVRTAAREFIRLYTDHREAINICETSTFEFNTSKYEQKLKKYKEKFDKLPFNKKLLNTADTIHTHGVKHSCYLEKALGTYGLAKYKISFLPAHIEATKAFFISVLIRCKPEGFPEYSEYFGAFNRYKKDQCNTILAEYLKAIEEKQAKPKE